MVIRYYGLHDWGQWEELQKVFKALEHGYDGSAISLTDIIDTLLILKFYDDVGFYKQEVKERFLRIVLKLI